MTKATSKPPPRADDCLGMLSVAQDRMHQILSIAAMPNRAGCLYTWVYTWCAKSWLTWLERNGYLTREGEYGYYPSDGPNHQITEKGRMWLMREGHGSTK